MTPERIKPPEPLLAQPGATVTGAAAHLGSFRQDHLPQRPCSDRAVGAQPLTAAGHGGARGQKRSIDWGSGHLTGLAALSSTLRAAWAAAHDSSSAGTGWYR